MGHELDEGRAIRLHDRRRGHAGGDVGEPGGGEPRPRRLGIGELPRLGPVREVRRVGRRAHQGRRALVLPLEVGAAAALRHQPPAGRQRGEQAAEQPIVIEHPVERRGAEDGVGAAGDRQRRGVGVDERDPAADAGAHRGARRGQHVGRLIDADGAPVRQPPGEQLGEPAGAAADVEHRLVAAQRQAIEDGLAPGELRARHPVVGRGVPLARRRTSSSSSAISGRLGAARWGVAPAAPASRGIR